MRAADFEFTLPPELVAQNPAPQRDQSRLLVLHRDTGLLQHQAFPDLLQHLRPGDLMVLNDSKVIPARLRGKNQTTGGAFEILLIEENDPNDWWAMLRPGKRAQLQAQIALLDQHSQNTGINATVIDINPEGHRRLRFSGTENIMDELERIGEMPLPPYIKRPPAKTSAVDRERYQTVYSHDKGSVAAPTAGLHFTPELLAKIRGAGVQICHVTLHVGPGTFAPVKSENLADHVMHEERFSVTGEAAHAINLARREHRRVIAVGTTSVRVLESAADTGSGLVQAGRGRTRIFLHPPCAFKVVDALVTNFHLPSSTLLMLVSAFAAPGKTGGRETILSAYAEAIRQRYRFFSYGDAMLIL